MNESLCKSCDYVIVLTYKNKKGTTLTRMRCDILKEYVETYDVKSCNRHSNLPPIEQLKEKVRLKYLE